MSNKTDDYFNLPVDTEGYRTTEDGIKFKLETVPDDPRFPSCDKSYQCWQNYVDFHKCRKLLAEEHPACQKFFRAFMTMCPESWIERWNENLEAGILPFNIEPPPELVQKYRNQAEKEK